MDPTTAAAVILAWAALPTDQPTQAQKLSELIAQEMPGATQQQARRIFEFSRDPDKGGKLNLSEAQTGMRLQKSLGVELKRSSAGADYVDTKGRVYDAMGNFQERFFNHTSFENSLKDHYLKQGVDKVVVDVTGWSPSGIAKVESMIARQAPANQSRTLLLK
jgi:hypothetical protein